MESLLVGSKVRSKTNPKFEGVVVRISREKYYKKAEKDFYRVDWTYTGELEKHEVRPRITDLHFAEELEPIA